MTSTTPDPGRPVDALLADWAEVAGGARRPAMAPRRVRTVGLAQVARLAGALALGVVLVSAVALVAPRGRGRIAGGAGAGSPAPSTDACPVTAPNLAHGGAWPDTLLDHGADGLFTALAPSGTIEVPHAVVVGTNHLWHTLLIHRDGPALGPVTVTASRRAASPDPSGDYLLVEYPDGQGDDPILRVDVGFPAPGCWEVTLHAGTSQLTFVTGVEIAAAPASPVAGPTAAP